MKKKNPLSAIVFLLLLNMSNTYGQTTMEAEFRPRTEFRQGFRKPLADTLSPAFVTLQRTRLNADYKTKKLNARFSLQDARVWGNSDTKANSSKIELNEAWFEYLICTGFSVQAGRQTLKYDDQRLFTSSNWGNTGIAHDMMLLKYNSSFLQVHSGFAYNNSKDTLFDMSYAYTPKQNYKTMGYLWLSKSVYKGTTLSLIGVCEGFQNKTDYKIVYPRMTFGGNLVYANDSSAWGAILTAYVQHGKDPGKTVGKGYADLKAFFLAAKASYKFISKLSGSIGVDYYSGSATDIDPSKSNTFNRLYGSTHSFNGSMEYFSSLPTQGLIDYYGGINSNITSKLSMEITTHFFYFDKNFVYNKEVTEKNLGTEADLTINYTVSKEIAFQLGYSRYFNSSSTSSFYKMPGIKAYQQQWAYLMVTIRPQLYKTPPMPD
jgi:hypothetical protein